MSWLDTLAEIRKTDWSKVPGAEREAAAREVVQIASYAAAAASVVPIPLVDIAFLLPVHTSMVMTVGHVHGRNLSDAEAKRVALELGAVAGVTLAGRAALSAIKKILLPGLGGVLAAPASFAVTWALGRAAIAYFKDPSLSRDDLRRVFSDAFKEGKASYDEERLEEFEEAQEGGASSSGEEEAEVVDATATPSATSSDQARKTKDRGEDRGGRAEGDARTGVRTKKRSM